MNEMVSRLDTYRSELALQTLVLLNEKVGGHMKSHGQRFDRLEQRDDDIIEAISISQRRSAHEAATYHRQTREELREVITAILTHRDGQTTTLSQPIPRPKPWEVTNEHDSGDCMTLQSLNSFDMSRGDATALLSDFKAVQRRLLENLSFSRMRNRVDEVASAYQESFK